MLSLLFSEYRPLLQDFLAVSVCLAAFIWGRGPERAIAATWLILFEVVTRLYRAISDSGFRSTEVDPLLASTDVLAGLIWIAIAINANRNYPLWIAAMQVLALTAHVARGLTETISPLAYLMMAIAPGWFQLVILGLGVFRHRRREKQFGRYQGMARPGAIWRIAAGPEIAGVGCGKWISSPLTLQHLPLL